MSLDQYFNKEESEQKITFIPLISFDNEGDWIAGIFEEYKKDTIKKGDPPRDTLSLFVIDSNITIKVKDKDGKVISERPCKNEKVKYTVHGNVKQKLETTTIKLIKSKTRIGIKRGAPTEYVSHGHNMIDFEVHLDNTETFDEEL